MRARATRTAEDAAAAAQGQAEHKGEDDSVESLKAKVDELQSALEKEVSRWGVGGWGVTGEWGLMMHGRVWQREQREEANELAAALGEKIEALSASLPAPAPSESTSPTSAARPLVSFPDPPPPAWLLLARVSLDSVSVN
jgi:hypothetical protein